MVVLFLFKKKVSFLFFTNFLFFSISIKLVWLLDWFLASFFHCYSWLEWLYIMYGEEKRNVIVLTYQSAFFFLSFFLLSFFSFLIFFFFSILKNKQANDPFVARARNFLFRKIFEFFKKKQTNIASHASDRTVTLTEMETLFNTQIRWIIFSISIINYQLSILNNLSFFSFIQRSPFPDFCSLTMLTSKSKNFWALVVLETYLLQNLLMKTLLKNWTQILLL